MMFSPGMSAIDNFFLIRLSGLGSLINAGVAMHLELSGLEVSSELIWKHTFEVNCKVFFLYNLAGQTDIYV